MPTYLIKRETAITRQEGNTADVTLVIPDIIDMNLYEAEFKIVNASHRTILSKSSVAGTLVISGQVIEIPLPAGDTEDKAGNHLWELEIYNQTQRFTIGRGKFIIIRKYTR